MVARAPVERQEEQIATSPQPMADWPADASESEPVPEWHRREERIFFVFVLVALLIFIAAVVVLWRVLVR